MQVHVEKLSPVLMQFQIEVPAETVASEVETAFNQLKKTARVRGFRRGKAPRKVLAQLYGPSIRADVAQRLMDSSLQRAMSEKAIQPLTKPSVEPAELKPKEAFSFKARFEVRPEIEKVEWEGLEAERMKTEITDEAIDKEIERLRGEHATEEPVEGRAAAKGDLVTLGLRFEVDGETHNEDVDKIEVGGGQLLPFLDEALDGLEVGSSKEVTGVFPDNHRLEQLRGQETQFHIELKELKARILPSVDDEFAKDCEHENLEAMKKALTETLQKKIDQQAEEELAKQLVAKLCEKNPIEVPPSLVEQQTRMTERELQMIAQMTGQDMSDPNLQARVRMDAEVKVRAGLLMAEIAKAKEVKVTDEDIENGYSELAEQTGKNVAKIRAEYADRQRRELLIGMILEDKVLDLIEGAAKINDPS